MNLIEKLESSETACAREAVAEITSLKAELARPLCLCGYPREIDKPCDYCSLKAEVERLKADVLKWKRIRTPTHGSCCTCQSCGLDHDSCRCDLDDVAAQLATAQATIDNLSEKADNYDSIAELIDDQPYDGRTVVDCVGELKATIDKLPKCWRLNEAGELVQDCPVVPIEDTVWRHVDGNGVTEFVLVIDRPRECDYNYALTREVHRFYSTPEAAQAAREAE